MSRIMHRVVLASVLSSVWASPAFASGLLMHNGFEACWVSAKTKPQFLELVRASIDGTTACIPVQSGSQSGIGYTICNVANGCGAGLAGCVVSMQAGPFSGDFVAGHFTGPGTTSDISVPVTTTVFSPCTISLTAISLGYTLDYLMQTDGSDGVYSDELSTPVVAIGSYASTNNCNPVLASLIAGYVPQAIAAAETNAATAIEPGLRTDTLDRSICPLSAP
ncbi:MAG TPA: hypothetical protein PLR28_11020 [Dokdonella sp.]|uniref:hypothetical protein n=1 Tax=Dokdonella sp. TaxID=2291710 RepID=UPI002B88A1C5|nr:hypothetical protein [Dokdonella sp.]HOX72840.1 hypothetical protein [Dokdonella sp.]HPG95076.1 hypothetical protein [Dokdonella sp.]